MANYTKRDERRAETIALVKRWRMQKAEEDDHPPAGPRCKLCGKPARYVVTFVVDPQAFYCEEHLREADAALERGRP